MSTQDSDEVREMFCEPCHKDGFKNSITANGFCKTCVEYLCSTCLRYHKKHLPHHRLQDTHDMPLDFCLDPCPSHPAEFVKFHCKTCDVFACPRCKIDRHTSCTEVLHLPNLSVDFEKSDELKDLNMKINKAKKELGNVRGLIMKGEKHAEMLKTDVRKGMKKQREDMNLRYDTLEKNIKRTILEIHNDDKAELEKQSRKADTAADELATVQADIQNTTRALQRCKLFIKSKNAYKVVNSVEERLKQIKEGIVVHDYSYEPVEYPQSGSFLGSVRMQDTLKSTDLKADSYISRIYQEAKMTEKWIRQMRTSRKVFLTAIMMLLALLDFKFIVAVEVLLFYSEIKPIIFSAIIKTANWFLQNIAQNNVIPCSILNYIIRTVGHLYCEDINVKTPENIRCNITGLCFVSEDNLAAVDNNNSSVKIIDIGKKSVTSELSLGGETKNKPWDITRVGENKLAVTLPFSETVCFLLFKHSKDSVSALSCYRKLPVDGECRGIVCIDDKLIISFCGNFSSVKILDMDGKPLKSYCKDVSGRNLFSHPYYITISPDHNTIYVSDYKSNQVTRLSMNRKVLAVYKQDELTNLFGVTVDKAGTVYVCGLNAIYKLSADLSDGQKQFDVKNRLLNNIVHCDQRQILYVASWNQNTIVVFA